MTAKGVLRPFEPKKLNTSGMSAAEIKAAEIAGLVDGTGIDELRAELRNLEENGEQEKDDLEGFVEVLDEMSEDEREEWNEAVQPLRNALVKVCNSNSYNRSYDMV